MSNWIARFLGRVTLTDQVDSIVAKAEPSIWQAIDGCVPMGSPNEARGYVWARSATAIRNATFEIAGHLDQRDVQTVIRQARERAADLVVSQLQMYADERPVVRRVVRRAA
jgi:hypothetical protein